MNVTGCFWFGSPPCASRCSGCLGGRAAPWMHHGVNTTCTWASAKLLPHGGAFTLDLTTKRHLQSAERQLRRGGLCSPLPWSMKCLCLAFALRRHGHHGCANACTSISTGCHWGLLEPSRLPWQLLVACSCSAMQCPAAETPSWSPAEKGWSALHPLPQGLPHSPTQLCHFQALCWFSHQTGC